MRDWQKDMDMCEKATAGPWDNANEAFPNNVYCDDSTGSIIAKCPIEYVLRIPLNVENNAEFIAESRAALPYWLERYKAAEELLRELQWSSGANGMEPYCEFCDKLMSQGHTDDCRLSNFLREVQS